MLLFEMLAHTNGGRRNSEVAIVLPSPVHGLGLWAAHKIGKGAPIAQWVEGTDYRLDPAVWRLLPAALKKILGGWTWRDRAGGVFRLGHADEARYMNHSPKPNVGYRDGLWYAMADLSPGTELLCDYTEHDADMDVAQPWAPTQAYDGRALAAVEPLDIIAAVQWPGLAERLKSTERELAEALAEIVRLKTPAQ